MQTATSETEIKSRYLSICVHHYTLRAPCSKDQGILDPQYDLTLLKVVSGSHARTLRTPQ